MASIKFNKSMDGVTKGKLYEILERYIIYGYEFFKFKTDYDEIAITKQTEKKPFLFKVIKDEKETDKNESN